MHLQRNTTCFETSGLHIPEHLGSKPIADTHVIIEPLPSFFDHYGGVWVKRDVIVCHVNQIASKKSLIRR